MLMLKFYGHSYNVGTCRNEWIPCVQWLCEKFIEFYNPFGWQCILSNGEDFGTTSKKANSLKGPNSTCDYSCIVYELYAKCARYTFCINEYIQNDSLIRKAACVCVSICTHVKVKFSYIKCCKNKWEMK